MLAYHRVELHLGVDALSSARESCSTLLMPAHTPAVMSSQSSQDAVLKAFEAGARDYLVKPIRKNEVTTLWLLLQVQQVTSQVGFNQ